MTTEPDDSSLLTEIVTIESVNVVEFFNKKCAGPVLVGYGGETYVAISVLHFPEIETEIDEFTLENLTEIQHGSSVQCFAWSPKTSMRIHPVGITFCIASLDYQLHLYTLNSKTEVSKSVLGEHNSFINDCAFEPLRGDQVASVGDDKKCRLWNTDVDKEECYERAVLPLTSAGMSVKWNPVEPGKLLVAEQSGTIRMYDALALQPILSLRTLNTGGLLACDWSVLNPSIIGAVVGSKWFVWDATKSTLPEANGPAHAGTATEFRWSRSDEHTFATRGRPGNEAVVFNARTSKEVLAVDTRLGRGLSWCSSMPVCAVGGDRKIYVYNVDLV